MGSNIHPFFKKCTMAWRVTTQPSLEVWTLSEVKNYLKVDTSADDTLITTLLQSAREVAERYLNQALITQTITEKLDSKSMDLEKSNVEEVKRLFPCAEGAGYAGGIVSAAMDGERCMERIIELYKS